MRSKKRKNAMPEATLDKMDDYLKQNYMKVIAVAGILLLVFVIIQGIGHSQESSRLKSAERVGTLENAGLATAEQIENFAYLAGDSNEADYVHYKSAMLLSRLGDITAATEEAAKVTGDFAPYAQSLSYDLAGGNGAVSDAELNGAFSPIWYYRAVLVSAEADTQRLMDGFRTAWPDSLLLEQLDKWGY